MRCAVNADCSSGLCTYGTCVSCSDGVQNGDETGIDCGGSVCDRCVDGMGCSASTDCSSAQCEDVLAASAIVDNGIDAASDRITLTSAEHSIALNDVIRIQDAPQWTHLPRKCVTYENIRLWGPGAGQAPLTVDECKAMCIETPGCVAIEYGVDYGGLGRYQPGDCQAQSSQDWLNCNGGHHNLDLYIMSSSSCGATPMGTGLVVSSVSDAIITFSTDITAGDADAASNCVINRRQCT